MASSVPSEWKIKKSVNTSGDKQPAETGFWLTVPDDNIDIYARLWQPPTGIKLLATLTFIHGLGEHISRYDHVFSKFSAQGIRVLAFDQRGFGRTVLQNSHHVDGSKSNAMVLGDSQGLTVALADIYRACRVEKEVGLREEGVPHFLFGHSMGGFLALSFAIQYGREVGLAGVIASAPAIRPGFPVPWAKRFFGRQLAKVLGSFNIPSGVDPTGISRDPAVVERYKQDPLVHDKGSLRCLASLIDGGEQLLAEDYKKFDSNLPILMTFGTEDKLTSYAAGKEFIEKLEANDKKFKSWDGLYHELHNEPEQAQVVQFYIDWIRSHAK